MSRRISLSHTPGYAFLRSKELRESVVQRRGFLKVRPMDKPTDLDSDRLKILISKPPQKL